MSRQQVQRWSVGLVATLALAATGLLYANATLLVATVIPLSYVLYGTLSRLPAESSLAVERRIEPAAPGPGDHVEVTLTVTNDGESVLPDVRLVDSVPDELVVTEGQPRLCGALSPGETRTTSYTVVAKRGSYTFERPVARLRSLAGTDRLTLPVDVTGDESLTCVSTVESVPRHRQTTAHTGTVPTDSGGSGLEFHSTREYRQGDPVGRIDWHHVAKTGEVTTVQYREEKTSKTVLMLDARPVNRVTPQPGHPTAVDRCAYAGERLYEVLTGSGVQTTVVATGLDSGASDDRVNSLLGPDGLAWAGPDQRTVPATAVFDAVAHAGSDPTGRHTPVPPRTATGEAVRAEGEQTESAHGHGSTPRNERRHPSSGKSPTTARTDGGDELNRLLARVPSDARVVLCSPLLDNWPVELGRSLSDSGYELLVVSPDPVSRGDEVRETGLGQRVTAVHRTLRLRELERTGATTVDWGVEQPFETALRETLPALAIHR